MINAFVVFMVATLALLGVISDIMYGEINRGCIGFLFFPYGMYRGIRFDLR